MISSFAPHWDRLGDKHIESLGTAPSHFAPFHNQLLLPFEVGSHRDTLFAASSSRTLLLPLGRRMLRSTRRTLMPEKKSDAVRERANNFGLPWLCWAQAGLIHSSKEPLRVSTRANDPQRLLRNIHLFVRSVTRRCQRLLLQSFVYK